ncbi:MAG: 3-oxoacyl-ACP reductase [Frankiales bacterium]|nr:3-oxoacyl-ACP reductase [Frankiales bacterium]
MDLGITGRSAYVVGRDSGLGRACAGVLAAEGVTLADSPVGCDIVVSHGDRRSPGALLGPDALGDLTAAWDAVVRTVEDYRTGLPGMVSRRWGRLVWIGSARARAMDADDDEIGAVVSLAMMGLHKVVTAEEGAHAVTANAVLRGGSATDEDVAHTVAFLCSTGAGYLSGVTLTVDGGAGSAMF